MRTIKTEIEWPERKSGQTLLVTTKLREGVLKTVLWAGNKIEGTNFVQYGFLTPLFCVQEKPMQRWNSKKVKEFHELALKEINKHKISYADFLNKEAL